jgi:hypothetical protein
LSFGMKHLSECQPRVDVDAIMLSNFHMAHELSNSVLQFDSPIIARGRPIFYVGSTPEKPPFDLDVVEGRGMATSGVRHVPHEL